MSTYKVIQDIEAEDKILGPLTLKQFIAALIGAFFYYLCFIFLTKGPNFLVAVFLPFALLATFFAFPFGKDQPTEVWAAAKFQFLFKPRRRIWDQSGIKELVTITVPKKVERIYTDGLSQNEVRSRLSALASTIDSRGWAIKGVGASEYTPAMAYGQSQATDRLVSVSSLPQAVPDYQLPADADIMDEQNSPVAKQFTQMIDASQQAHRQQLMAQLNEVRTEVATSEQQPQVQQWFMPPAPSADAAQPTESEIEVIERMKAANATKVQTNSHLRTLQPLSYADGAQGASMTAMPAQQQPAPAPQPAVTAPADAAILNLASNNDFNISTLAREANKSKSGDGFDDEVVISLR